MTSAMTIQLPRIGGLRRILGRPRLVTVSILLGLLLFGLMMGYYRLLRALESFNSISLWYRYNIITAYTPEFAIPWVKAHVEPDVWQNVGPPPYLPELLESPWMGSFPLPELSSPDCNTPLSHTSLPPTLLAIYVFSTVRPKHRPRRDLYRKHSPLLTVPKEYRHLFDMKFVVGRSDIPEEETLLDIEQKEYGDLVRLDGLIGGENMDNGKSLHWLRWVGSSKARPSQWIFKCDDDTMPIFPNFLPWILKRDPSRPYYVGSSQRKNVYFRPYFSGLFYGFSYGVVRSISAANLTEEEINRGEYEDLRIGDLMWMLPSKPGQPPTPNESLQYSTGRPASPDPRTGLIRLDAVERMVDHNLWWGAPWYRSFAYHGMKDENSFEDMLRYVTDGYEARGWKYEWSPSWYYYRYRDRC